jgi:hypothetical protein
MHTIMLAMVTYSILQGVRGNESGPLAISVHTPADSMSRIPKGFLDKIDSQGKNECTDHHNRCKQENELFLYF